MQYARFSCWSVLLLATALYAQTPTITSQSAPNAPEQPQAQGPATVRPAQPLPELQPPATSAKKTDREKSASKPDDNDKPLPASEVHNPTLWHDPGNIAALDLYYGQGGKDGMPTGPFTFESEDMNGTNPKFNVHDSQNRKWRVKLGNEAQPEVVASRLLWAMGYYVNDDYVLPEAHIDGLHIKRGGNLAKNGNIKNARFARKPEGQKKIGIWEWKKNPFTGTRELNGLRVLMAVMNNWDLKDVNNAVYTDKDSDQQIFLISDVGATFASNGFSFTKNRSKGNLGTFKGSKFIEHETPTTVSFATPRPPTGLLLETFGVQARDYFKRQHMEWIGQDIPRKDARWIGDMLGQLSHEQLVDAFRAANFPPDVIDEYVILVENRIQLLKGL